MSDDSFGLGWLPVEARDDLEEKRDRASREEAARLLALDPRARVLELLARATATDDTLPKLRPAALRRVLASFEGADLPGEAELALRFPRLVEEG
jgi:hypothetical protein